MTDSPRPLPFERNAFDLLPFGIQIFDREGTLLNANPAFLSLLGIEDLSVLRIRRLADDPLLDAPRIEALKKGDAVRVFGPFRRSDWVLTALDEDTSYFVEKTLTPVALEPGGYIVTVRDITEMRRDLEALRKSETLYRNLVESSDDLIWQCDSEGRFTYLNPAWEKMMGYKSSEMLGRTYRDFVSEEQTVIDHAAHQKILAGESVRQYELVFRKKDGSPLNLSSNVKLYTDENRRLLGARGSASDITQRKLAEAALSESRHRYQQVVEHSPLPMHFYRLEGDDLIFTDVNPAADRLLQYDNTRFLEKRIEDAFPPLVQTEVPSRYRLAAEDGIPWHDEFVSYENGAVKRAFDIHAFQIGPGQMVSIFMDNTPRKQAEEALKNEKERIAVTLRSIGDGVIAANTDGEIVLMNKMAERLTGWSVNEALGKPLSEVFHIINKQTQAACENPLEKVLRTLAVVELENDTILISKDGTERIIGDSGAPIFDAESRIVGMVLVFRDITEKTKTREILERTQKLESLGVLAGGIAHDFNNLLGGVFGYIDLAKDISKDPAVRDYLEKAFFIMERARGLSGQLLTFAKGGDPILKTADVADLVMQSAKFALSGSRVTLQCEFQDNLWLCNVDENQFGQVIDNIAINASQAMPKGGVLTIRGENVSLPDSSGLAPVQGRYVRISIEDQGVGIPENLLPHIFDPFFTTKQKGNGLGLATCYSIIQKHGGFIDVASKPGKGSVFHIFVPASGAEGRPSPVRPGSRSKGEGVVLVLDDEEYLREILSDMLKQIGYDSVCAATGEALVLRYKDADTAAQTVAAILDLTIQGGMGGLKTEEALHRINPDLPIFVASGYSTDPVIAAPKRYGFIAGITKPYRMKEISEVLSTHLGNGKQT